MKEKTVVIATIKGVADQADHAGPWWLSPAASVPAMPQENKAEDEDLGSVTTVETATERDAQVNDAEPVVDLFEPATPSHLRGLCSPSVRLDDCSDSHGVLVTCDHCGSREFIDTPIHGGRSTRRDCANANCNHTWGFPTWAPPPD